MNEYEVNCYVFEDDLETTFRVPVEDDGIVGIDTLMLDDDGEITDERTTTVWLDRSRLRFALNLVEQSPDLPLTLN
jgi:hypothetical protein